MSDSSTDDERGFRPDYAAPVDLRAARRRIDGVARLRHCGEMTVVLAPGVPQVQLARLSGETRCVISEMVLCHWDAASIRSLCRALHPDGVLFFLEPTADLGWRRALHRVGRRLWRAGLGHDFESDIPNSIRAGGMVVTTTDRFGLGPAGIRSYVWGEARYFQPSPSKAG